MYIHTISCTPDGLWFVWSCGIIALPLSLSLHSFPHFLFIHVPPPCIYWKHSPFMTCILVLRTTMVFISCFSFLLRQSSTGHCSLLVIKYCLIFKLILWQWKPTTCDWCVCVHVLVIVCIWPPFISTCLVASIHLNHLSIPWFLLFLLFLFNLTLSPTL